MADQPKVRLPVTKSFSALDGAGGRTTRQPGNVFVEHRQRHVGQQRREDPTLRSSRGAVLQQAILSEDARLEKRLHQPQHTVVADASTHPTQQGGGVDLVETGLDVSLDYPVITPGARREVT